MRYVPSIKRNFFWNVLLTASNVMFPLVVFPHISRTLLADSMGKVDFAVTLVNYFIMFAALGIPTYGIRECAAVRNNCEKLSKVVQELLFINIIITFFVSICFFITIIAVPRLKQDYILYLIIGINLLLNPLTMNWLYSALEDYRYITIRTIVLKLCSVILVYLMIHSPNDYLKYAVINVFSVSGVNFFNFFHSRKYVTYKITKLEIKRHLKAVLTFFATSVAISIYTNLDILMIGFLAGDTQVGYYSAALKIRTAAATAVTILSTILLPRLSYYATNGQYDQFDSLIQKSFNYTLLVSMPLTLFFSAYATPSIVLLSGTGFKNAGSILFCLMPTVFFAGLSNVTGTQLLVPYGKENKLFTSIVVGALVDFFLNLIFIPAFGAKGAAIATSIAEFMVLLVQIIISRKYIRKLFDYKTLISEICSLMISNVLMQHLNIIQLNSVFLYLLIKFILLIGCYLILLIIFRNPFLISVFKSRGG